MGTVPKLLQNNAHLAIAWVVVFKSLHKWDTSQKGKEGKMNFVEDDN
jgi:hypothetical protein